MRLPKVLSVSALALLACQSICGVYLINNPEAAAEGSAGFHMTLGITTLVITAAAVISVFHAAKKAQ